MGYGSPGGAATFLDLLDTPETYSGQALKLAKVNAGEDGLNLGLLLSFTDWYAGGAPTSYPWEFEAALPFTPEAVFLSPILKNAMGQYYCYLVGTYPDTFYLYNITTKQYHRLADLSVAYSQFTYRPIALSPNGEKLACFASDGSRIEVYDIEANTWTVSTAPPAQIGGKLVWVDDDTIWTTNRSGTFKFFRYVVSTTTWTQFTNSHAATQFNPQTIACNDDGSILYCAGAGSFYYTVIKYVISTDTYSEMSPQSTYLGSQRRVFYCSDRVRIWYTFEGDWKAHYFKCEDETIHVDQFPANPQRDKPSLWAFSAYELSACLWEARATAPRLMSYFGSGSWRLAQKTLTDYNLVVFKKPADGFSIQAVDRVNGHFIPIPLFSTLVLPAGTWEFFYPKDGDYTKLKIAGSVLK